MDKIPIGFIAIIIGIIFLSLNWIPLIGWLFAGLAFLDGVVSLYFQATYRDAKYVHYFFISIVCVVVVVMIILSTKQFLTAMKLSQVQLAKLSGI